VVGLVILDMDQSELTLRCLRSIERGDVLPEWIVLVENGRDSVPLEGLGDILRSRTTVLRPGRNLGCAGGRNLDVNYLRRNTSTSRCVTLDNDVILPEDFVRDIRSSVLPRFGVGAPVIESHPSGRMWSAGGRIGAGGRIVLVNDRDGLVGEHVDVDWVPGACLVFDVPTWAHVGTFDDWMGFLFEDVDWCVRVRRHGGSIRLWPGITLRHEEHQSLGGRGSARRAYLWSRNGTVLRSASLGLGWLDLGHWTLTQLRMALRELLVAGGPTIAISRLIGLVHGYVESQRRRWSSRPDV